VRRFRNRTITVREELAREGRRTVYIYIHSGLRPAEAAP
jgi:hypothetical protein